MRTSAAQLIARGCVNRSRRPPSSILPHAALRSARGRGRSPIATARLVVASEAERPPTHCSCGPLRLRSERHKKRTRSRRAPLLDPPPRCASLRAREGKKPDRDRDRDLDRERDRDPVSSRAKRCVVASEAERPPTHCSCGPLRLRSGRHKIKPDLVDPPPRSSPTLRFAPREGGEEARSRPRPRPRPGTRPRPCVVASEAMCRRERSRATSYALFVWAPSAALRATQEANPIS